MRKIYMSPTTEILEYAEQEELLGSVSSDYGIGSGGVDGDGSLNPASRVIMIDAVFGN